MSIWVKKDGKLVSITPKTDLLAILMAELVAFVAADLAGLYGLSGLAAGAAGLASALAIGLPLRAYGRKWTIRQMRECRFE